MSRWERWVQAGSIVPFVSAVATLIVGLTFLVKPDARPTSKQIHEVASKVTIVILENAETISIIGLASLYLKGAPDRRDQKHYLAWQVIDNATRGRISATSQIEESSIFYGRDVIPHYTSYALQKAIQDLNEDEVSLKGLDAEGANLEGIHLEGADLTEANLNGANFTKANLDGVDFTNARLDGANLSEAHLNRANLTSVVLTGKARLICTELNYANLYFANLPHAFLPEVKLFKANLIKADLTGANLLGADLRGALFSKPPEKEHENEIIAYFYRAIIFNAPPEQEENFINTSPIDAELSGADLTGANLMFAHLEGATLSYIDLYGVNLQGVTWDSKTLWPAKESFAHAKNIPDALKKQLGIKEENSALDIQEDESQSSQLLNLFTNIRQTVGRDQESSLLGSRGQQKIHTSDGIP